jgi:chromosome segregation ATPase
MRLFLLSAVLVLSVGCGIKRVPNKVLEKLPYEARIELLEAENDLALAVDKVDEAHSEVMRTRDGIRRAKDRLKAAESEVSAAQDAASKEVAELAVIEGDARYQYLRSKQKVNVEEESLAELGKTCAYARFELSRLLVARKAKLEGSEALDVASFENQAKDCEAKLAGKRTEAKQLEADAEALKATWDGTKEKLARKTFDARASPFVE